MYYDFFGEFLRESPHDLNVDIENMTLAQLKTLLLNIRDSKEKIESDLAIIGYGPNRAPTEFFAAFNNINDQTLVKQALAYLPIRAPNSRWYIYFINDRISYIVRDKKDHHWASAYRWLAQIGLQDLNYTGSKTQIAN